MSGSSRILIVCAITTLAMLVSPCLAATKYFRPSGSSANWTDSGVWFDAETGGSVVSTPSEVDIAVIVAGKTCVIDSAVEAHFFFVRSSAELWIDEDGVLTLGNSLDETPGVASEVNGAVYLLDPTSEIVIIAQDHEFYGDGIIFGDWTAATISISASLTLTNSMDDSFGAIRGSMTIQGLTSMSAKNGVFNNEGHLIAEAGPHMGQELILHEDTILDDLNPSSEWVAQFGGTLVFERDALYLSGLIHVRCKSVVRVEADVLTCGDFDWEAGTWTVLSGGTLRFYANAGFPAGTEIDPKTDQCPSWEIIGADSGLIACGN